MLARNLERFQVLVLCAKEVQPSSRHFPYSTVVRCPFDDSLDEPLSRHTARMVTQTANLVAWHLRRERRCLVTCNAGLNRSGLVTALTLHLMTGFPGFECVRIVQEERPGALFNPQFVRMIEALPARRATA